MQKFKKSTLALKQVTYEFSTQYLHFWGQGEPSNFTLVNDAKF